jgi:hypothetical protein
VSRDIGEQEAGDSASGTARSIIDISAALRLPEGLAENPDVQTAHFNAGRGKLASAPDFHALHVLCWLAAHDRIIAGHWHFVGRAERSTASAGCDRGFHTNQAVL